MHGQGATRKASATAREFRGGAEKPPRAHLRDRILMEDDGNDCLLVRRPDSKGITHIRCSRCLQNKSHGQFPQGASSVEDNETICFTCRSQWLPSGVVYNGHPLPIILGSSPTCFLVARSSSWTDSGCRHTRWRAVFPGVRLPASCVSHRPWEAGTSPLHWR